jgi:hypothetical protein
VSFQPFLWIFMSAVQWLAIGATALLLVGVGVSEERRRQRQHRRINQPCADICARLHCGGGFHKWRGEKCDSPGGAVINAG